MSTTRFVEMLDVRAKIKTLRPKQPRKLNALLKVEPRSKRYTLVGTAFDYLLRFELERRAPHAISTPWVAEAAPDLIWRKISETSSGGMDLLTDVEPEQHLFPDEVAALMRTMLENAKAAVAAYLKLKAPTTDDQAELAAHAIRLGKLDPVVRAWKLDPAFQEASPEDVQDLVDLLAIVPFGDLLHDKVLLLNPTFGQASSMVGGADGDLIAGDLLVDFKTTKKR